MTNWGGLQVEAFHRALADFKAGRPYLEHLREGARCELEGYRASGVVKAVQVAACPDSCPACLAVDHRVIPLEEALATSPLPVPGCTHTMGKRSGWCRCTYVAVLDDED